MNRFRDRIEAGEILAGLLTHLAGRDDLVVLALPRGGVPVGYEIARHLGAPLEVMVVRKLGVPGHEELAMGAIASGGFRVMNEDVLAGTAISEGELNAVIESEQRELDRREHLCRQGEAPLALEGRMVILVDDGVATGATMRAAAQAVRARKPSRLIIATPVIPPSAVREFESEGMEVVAALTPAGLSSIGEWYRDFSQTSDGEVRSLLALTRRKV